MSECLRKWEQLLEVNHMAESLLREFMQSYPQELLPLIREALDHPHDRSIGFRLARLMPIEYREGLFGDMLRFACEASYVPTIIESREFLLTLPRTWLLAEIRTAIQFVLDSNDEWMWRRLLEFTTLIDRNLTVELAHLAKNHEDENIQSVGTDFENNPNPR